MTFAPDWMEAEETRRAWMAENSLYRAEDEHASCGVGLVVNIDGRPSRKVVTNGINALKAVWHRGAVDADGKTGDGAGIHVQIPVPFFYDQVRRTGHEPDPAKLAAAYFSATGMLSRTYTYNPYSVAAAALKAARILPPTVD